MGELARNLMPLIPPEVEADRFAAAAATEEGELNSDTLDAVARELTGALSYTVDPELVGQMDAARVRMDTMLGDESFPVLGRLIQGSNTETARVLKMADQRVYQQLRADAEMALMEEDLKRTGESTWTYHLPSRFGGFIRQLKALKNEGGVGMMISGVLRGRASQFFTGKAAQNAVYQKRVEERVESEIKARFAHADRFEDLAPDDQNMLMAAVRNLMPQTTYMKQSSLVGWIEKDSNKSYKKALDDLMGAAVYPTNEARPLLAYLRGHPEALEDLEAEHAAIFGDSDYRDIQALIEQELFRQRAEGVELKIFDAALEALDRLQKSFETRCAENARLSKLKEAKPPAGAHPDIVVDYNRKLDYAQADLARADAEVKSILRVFPKKFASCLKAVEPVGIPDSSKIDDEDSFQADIGRLEEKLGSAKEDLLRHHEAQKREDYRYSDDDVAKHKPIEKIVNLGFTTFAELKEARDAAQRASVEGRHRAKKTPQQLLGALIYRRDLRSDIPPDDALELSVSKALLFQDMADANDLSVVRDVRRVIKKNKLRRFMDRITFNDSEERADLSHFAKVLGKDDRFKSIKKELIAAAANPQNLTPQVVLDWLYNEKIDRKQLAHLIWHLEHLEQDRFPGKVQLRLDSDIHAFVAKMKLAYYVYTSKGVDISNKPSLDARVAAYSELLKEPPIPNPEPGEPGIEAMSIADRRLYEARAVANDDLENAEAIGDPDLIERAKARVEALEESGLGTLKRIGDFFVTIDALGDTVNHFTDLAKRARDFVQHFTPNRNKSSIRKKSRRRRRSR